MGGRMWMRPGQIAKKCGILGEILAATRIIYILCPISLKALGKVYILHQSAHHVDFWHYEKQYPVPIPVESY